MLVLFCKLNESIWIDRKIQITMIAIRNARVRLWIRGIRIQENARIYLPEGASISIKEDIEVKVIRINDHGVRLGFDAPKDVIIDREKIMNEKIASEAGRS